MQWISDSQSKDGARAVIDSLGIDFDYLGLKAYLALVAHRPASSIAFAHALINESTVDQILGSHAPALMFWFALSYLSVRAECG